MLCIVGSSTQGPEDDSVESKHVAPLSHYMFNFTTVVFDGTSPPVISQTLRDGTPQVQEHYVDISHTEFHPNQSKIWKIWVEINLCPEIKQVNFQETHACSVTLKKGILY